MNRLEEQFELIKEGSNRAYNFVFGIHNFLNEEQHPIPNIEQYLNAIVRTIWPLLEEGDFTVEISKGDFNGIDTFFNNIEIILNISYHKDSLDSKYSGDAYPIQKIDENGKAHECKIKAELSFGLQTIRDTLASFVYHEFHHLYEDYKRLVSTDKTNGFINYNIASTYGDSDKIRQETPIYGQYLSNLIYALSKVEQRAYLHEAIGEIKELFKKMPNLKARTNEQLKSATSAYKTYQKLKDDWSKLDEVTDVNIQNSLLQSFNTHAGVIGQMNDKDLEYFAQFKTYNADIKRYRFNSYESLLNFFLNKITFTWKKINDELDKIIETQKITEQFCLTCSSDNTFMEEELKSMSRKQLRETIQNII